MIRCASGTLDTVSNVGKWRAARRAPTRLGATTRRERAADVAAFSRVAAAVYIWYTVLSIVASTKPASLCDEADFAAAVRVQLLVRGTLTSWACAADPLVVDQARVCRSTAGTTLWCETRRTARSSSE